MSSVLDKYYEGLLDIEFPIEAIQGDATNSGEYMNLVAQELDSLEPWEVLEDIEAGIFIDSIDAKKIADSHMESIQEIRILITTWRKQFKETISLRKMNFPIVIKRYKTMAVQDFRAAAFRQVAEIFIEELSHQNSAELNLLVHEAKAAFIEGVIDDSEYLLNDYIDEYLYQKLGFRDNPKNGD